MRAMARSDHWRCVSMLRWRPYLGEGHLDRPAPHEEAQHIDRICGPVGAQESLRFESGIPPELTSSYDFGRK